MATKLVLLASCAVLGVAGLGACEAFIGADFDPGRLATHDGGPEAAPPAVGPSCDGGDCATCAAGDSPTSCGPTCAICPVPANGVATCAAACGVKCDDGYAPCATGCCLGAVVLSRSMGHHTCAITQGDRVLKCWGANGDGQIGDETTGNATRAIAVHGIDPGVKAVVAGGGHTCAVTRDDKVVCWGDNTFGQLGNGSNAEAHLPAPVVIESDGGDLSVKAVAAGENHTCAMTSAGTVKCWGANAHGQLGTSSTNDSNIPADVVGITGVVAITAGQNHTCAILAAPGGVKCWGENVVYLTNDARTPVDIAGSAGVVAGACGFSHCCFRTSASELLCRGGNGGGQIGNGTPSQFVTNLVAPTGLRSGVTAAAGGYDHTCAALAAGGARCWGDDSKGQLGRDASMDESPTPVDVLGLPPNVIAIGAGVFHSCAAAANGAVYCWGANDLGQVGNGGAPADAHVASQVVGFP